MQVHHRIRMKAGADNNCLSEVATKTKAVFDLNGDGVIDKGEVGAVLERNYGIKLTRRELTAVFAHLDKNGNGSIDLMEFIRGFLQQPNYGIGAIGRYTKKDGDQGGMSGALVSNLDKRTAKYSAWNQAQKNAGLHLVEDKCSLTMEEICRRAALCIRRKARCDTEVVSSAMLIFRKFDENDDGKMDQEELGNTMRRFFQIHASETELTALFKHLKTDKSATTISRDEFIRGILGPSWTQHLGVTKSHKAAGRNGSRSVKQQRSQFAQTLAKTKAWEETSRQEIAYGNQRQVGHLSDSQPLRRTDRFFALARRAAEQADPKEDAGSFLRRRLQRLSGRGGAVSMQHLCMSLNEMGVNIASCELLAAHVAHSKSFVQMKDARTLWKTAGGKRNAAVVDIEKFVANMMRAPGRGHGISGQAMPAEVVLQGRGSALRIDAKTGTMLLTPNNLLFNNLKRA
jgi:Ca2+-binding EF-hand superfamily protein